MTEPRADLFQGRAFRLHSGRISDFKIDCDSLSDPEIAVIALQLARILPPFREVEGIPRGGLRLATALEVYATGKDEDPLLVADDVYTTGKSITDHAAGRTHIACVIFARWVPNSSNVFPLFTMSEAW